MDYALLTQKMTRLPVSFQNFSYRAYESPVLSKVPNTPIYSLFCEFDAYSTHIW